MPKIELTQGSEAWLDYRRSKIMATDSSIIIGTNNFRTPMELWEEKLMMRPPQPINDAMLRGNILEPEARKLASEVLGIDFHPCVYESNKHPWMAASLDGISPCGKYILEIKCPKEQTHLNTLNFGDYAKYYETQMYHQFGCVEDAIMCYYFSYRPEHENKYAIAEVLPCHESIENMIPDLYAFYKCMCTMCPPTWKFKEKK